MINRLLVSFSGGRTSGYMTWRILQEWRDKYDDIVVLFANTGLEHEKTLEFVHNCDKHFGFNTVWLEAVIRQGKGNGTRHKIVDFESASRAGKPFADAIDKYGIPNVAAPRCTENLKTFPMRSYVRDVLGHKRLDYKQCVGIRVDEIDRMSEPGMRAGVIYPLIEWGVTKTMVMDWWASQSFDLDLPEHLGNCVACFKKSDRKLLTIAKYHPEYFEFPARMEEKYRYKMENSGKYYNKVFYRNQNTAKDIIARSQEPFVPWTPTTAQQQIGLFSLDEMDISNGCTESCEVEYI